MNPTSLSYRSPVYRQLRELDAKFVECNGFAVATSVGNMTEQVAAAQKLALCDLSGLARSGVKGSGLGQWLKAQALSVPPAPNRALRQQDGSLLAMLADNEALVLTDIEQQSKNIGQLTTDFRKAASQSDSLTGLVVPRQHGQAWLQIVGHEMPATMAKLCAIDLRPGVFDNLQVAQTSVARLNAIVIREDFADIPAIHLLADSASAVYLWECILDAGAEHDLRVVGLDALRELCKT